MKYKYDPESWKWLIGEFCDVLKRFAQENLESPGAIVYRKNQVKTGLRKEIVYHMRTNYMQTVGGVIRFMRADTVVRSPDDETKLQRLSTTTAGRLLGMDHSTIIAMEKREKQQVT